jgi:transposase
MFSSSEVLSEILNLPSPWIIEDVRLDHTEEVADISLKYPSQTLFPCPECKNLCKVHDQTQERTWRHLNLWQYKTYLCAKLPRVRCSKHGVKQIAVPWAETHARMTLLMEKFTIDALKACETISQAAALLGMSWSTVCGVMKRAVARGLIRKERFPEKIPHLGVDEKSCRKGHDYLTIVYNHAEKRVEYVSEGREKSSLDSFFEKLSDSQISSIKGVSMDMWPAYTKSVKEHVPQGHRKIIHDRFHIMKHMNEAVDKVRQQEHQKLSEAGDSSLKGTMHMLRYADENRPEKYTEMFEELMSKDFKVSKAWRLKESLRHTWEILGRRPAKAYLNHWLAEVKDTGLKPVQKVANMIKKRITQVTSYCELRLSNGFAEGMNSKIMVVKRKARGFRTKEMFKTAI